MIDKIIKGDCVKEMKRFPNECVDLIFTDPPYNIGFTYDTYDDNKTDDDYLLWCRFWLSECYRILKKTGSMYIVIGDEYAAEINIILKELGFSFRNWIIWYYGFGQNQRKKFSRSHAHVFYFTKDAKNFTFNIDDIRVPSVRMQMGDKRANPKGKVPDDVWKISRIAGTFNERIKGFPCQMPLELVKRAIKASSNPNDLVFDPFMGSGTTAVAAKMLNRNYLGIEISESYFEIIKDRLENKEMIE